MPLFIIFLQTAEFSAFDPIVRPILAKSLTIPLPVCPFLESLYLLIDDDHRSTHPPTHAVSP